MSSAQIAARAIKSLEREDIRVLEAIEKSIPSFRSIPMPRIEKVAKLHPDEVKFRLGRLNKMGFIVRDRFGYVLLSAGLDLLALNHFANKNLVQGMGKSIGMGKESDVFEVVNDSGERAVLKFYRIGRTSFRSTRRSRSYVDAASQHQWLTINVRAAAKEEEGLKRASKAGVNVPSFIARNRHAVLMSEIDGTMLYKCSKEDIDQPEQLLSEIIENMRKSYIEGRIVNGDLSEYNVLYDGTRSWIIDWPQFVTINHRNALEMLRRDVENITSFFRKKFQIPTEEDEALAYITGKKEGKMKER